MPERGLERGLERDWIEPIVARVVDEVLNSHVAKLRSEIVSRVVEEIAAQSALAEPADNTIAPTSAAADLSRAVAEIQLGSSQREILRALLDASSRYAARVALFVVKGSHATGWEARGFANSDGIKDFALDENAAAVSRAIGDRVVASAPVADLDSRFLKQFGSPASGEGRVLPLILKDKVAALVYADSGTDANGVFDAGALDLLVLSTGAWLEVNSLRKQAHKEPSAAPADNPAEPVAAAPAAQALNDPFASHSPAFASGKAMAAAASAGDAATAVASAAVELTAMPGDATTIAEGSAAANSAVVAGQSETPAEVQSAVAEMEPALVEPIPTGHAEAKEVSEEPPVPVISPADQEVHRKAQRFARLLVDEIKLYNQAKVAEGRKKKDLYDRLKDTIEKSRATYHKRYGNTVAASGNYLQHEIMRSLAEDDSSIMGPNFRH